MNLTRRALVGSLVVLIASIGLPAGGVETESIRISSGRLTAEVIPDPFEIRFWDGDRLVLESSGGTPSADRLRAALGFTLAPKAETQAPLASYGLHADTPGPWIAATRLVSEEQDGLVVATEDPTRTLRVRVVPRADGVIEVSAIPSDPTGVTATGAAFTQRTADRFLGFGERSDGVDHTGRAVRAWAEEGPWSAGGLRPYTEPVFGERWQGPPPFENSSTNFPMPWFLSSSGYGFLLDSTYPNVFRLDGPSWSVETREPTLTYRVYAGPAPAQALERFTADVGHQPEPAEWFFGPWFQPGHEWREGFRDLDVPVTVAQTYAHYLPCASQHGRRDALRDEVAAYHEQGYKITTYVNSFVCETHPQGAYAEGEENGYFVKTKAGTTYPVPYAAFLDSSSAIVDFTNPQAATWWQGLISEALEDGYDGWMEDFGEYVPPDAETHDGRGGLAVHNDYCNLYHRSSHELTWPQKGSDFAQFVRCGYTGTAPYARIVWGGDPTEDDSKADGLAAAVSQGISMGLSGIGYWGSDIGGFHSLFTSGRTSHDLQSRWVEFGAFSGIMRTQKNGFGRPDQSGRSQVWDPEVLGVWRKYTKLRTQLFPYIWDAAQEYRRTGMPIMRHLALQYPDDSGSYSSWSEYEFMFGPDLLVAPVVDVGETERRLYLPPGEWYPFWDAVAYDEETGAFTRQDAEPIAGGRLVTVDAPLGEIPVFVRADACIDLLPPETDTLADVGSADGLVKLDDVSGQERTLAFGASC